MYRLQPAPVNTYSETGQTPPGMCTAHGLLDCAWPASISAKRQVSSAALIGSIRVFHPSRLAGSSGTDIHSRRPAKENTAGRRAQSVYPRAALGAPAASARCFRARKRVLRMGARNHTPARPTCGRFEHRRHQAGTQGARRIVHPFQEECDAPYRHPRPQVRGFSCRPIPDLPSPAKRLSPFRDRHQWRGLHRPDALQRCGRGAAQSAGDRAAGARRVSRAYRQWRGLALLPRVAAEHRRAGSHAHSPHRDPGVQPQDRCQHARLGGKGHRRAPGPAGRAGRDRLRVRLRRPGAGGNRLSAAACRCPTPASCSRGSTA